MKPSDLFYILFKQLFVTVLILQQVREELRGIAFYGSRIKATGLKVWLRAHWRVVRVVTQTHTHTHFILHMVYPSHQPTADVT